MTTITTTAMCANNNRHYRPYYRPPLPLGPVICLGLATGWGPAENVGLLRGVNSQPE